MTPSSATRDAVEENGPDEGRPSDENSDPLDPGADVDELADPVPEADGDSVQRGWEEADSMEGPAPTG
jgi:hypothetical protein